jgi:hypothetical protein
MDDKLLNEIANKLRDATILDDRTLSALWAAYGPAVYDLNINELVKKINEINNNE